MARANLKVADSVKTAFQECLSSPFWGLQLKIVDDTVHLERQIPYSTGTTFFDGMNEDIAKEFGAKLYCYCISPETYLDSRWCCVSYVPDNIHPKIKMLFAAARDDVKKSLDASRFLPDWHVTEIDEVNIKTYDEFRNRNRASAMSNTERLLVRVSFFALLHFLV